MSFFERFKLSNILGQQINPATEETVKGINDSVQLLKRIVKLLEPSSTQDSANRQKVTIDSITATATIGVSSLPTLANVTTVATVSNVGLIANVDPKFGMMDQARIAYNTGIRSNIKPS